MELHETTLVPEFAKIPCWVGMWSSQGLDRKLWWDAIVGFVVNSEVKINRDLKES